ncbi:ABC transporter substrate-binding protein [Trueperella bialowiezensis]|uniref:2-aminoethylphosphonate ABC transporter substrate-binding protein n=1 Tax=Trueperella bialowiezensis TaxID=312285 RepID=A0A3S4VB27_9ACTO|nr:extracellular solute-binding protein [Trueperella bialowiezensis]VEI13597.1 2-aminoethylphosphonate ABC transporter substrate-binding protein [Trueperella bialowiezensis]
MSRAKSFLTAVIAAFMMVGLTACSSSDNADKIIIFSNADDEAVEAIEVALDENGYAGKYIIQGFGTAELGGKLLTEGAHTQADVVTMSSFYLETQQERNDMFLPLEFPVDTIDETPDYYAPITSQEGALFYNTEVLKEHGLEPPERISDLAKPEYLRYVSVTDPKSSTTGWLLLLALIDEYGEEEAGEILEGIYTNAADHIESSGSGPLKKVRAGEMGIGFGLRHQAIRDKESGLPIEYVDPVEGNMSMTESVAVVDHGDDTKQDAMRIAQIIVEEARPEIQEYYPNALYTHETTDESARSKYPKQFREKLTADLLKEHIEISENAKNW